MNRIQHLLRAYHPIVISLLVGQMISRIATSMSMPFLALYLAKNTDMSAAMIGFVAGAGALAGTFGGFIGGALSDRYSRRLVMFVSLFAWSAVFIGFAFAKQPALLLLLSLLNGLCRSWFDPVAQVLMGDLTEPERRFKLYSLRYLMGNVGVAVGPLLGVYLGVGSSSVPFLVTGLIFLLYGCVLFAMMHAFGIQAIEGGATKEKITIGSAWAAVRRDRVLQLYTVGAILVAIGYSQHTVTLSQHLEMSFSQGVYVFGWLMTANAVTVIVLQMPLSRLVEKRRPISAIHAGNILFALGLVGFGLSPTIPLLFVSMICFTIGEILNYPAGSLLLDRLAPEPLRGAYFGAQTFGNFGYFLGPLLGGWLLDRTSGPVVFTLIAVILLSSSYFYGAGARRQAALGQEAPAARAAGF
ncbi:MFS transporter [Paenibacillus albicereus]|uniref:MFS transporter n=1 Tax=Paenibacillus albicereus TaxID=2726185 RepID=A0A6H2GUP7_9BACL|nr:MFS transporter [Paenibacillus albicereus]QJC51115.1 MFS transporter [Paenibacillus albicereus]